MKLEWELFSDGDVDDGDVDDDDVLVPSTPVQDVELKPDAEYPDWLWELDGKSPSLVQLQKDAAAGAIITLIYSPRTPSPSVFLFSHTPHFHTTRLYPSLSRFMPPHSTSTRAQTSMACPNPTANACLSFCAKKPSRETTLVGAREVQSVI